MGTMYSIEEGSERAMATMGSIEEDEDEAHDGDNEDEGSYDDDDIRSEQSESYNIYG